MCKLSSRAYPVELASTARGHSFAQATGWLAPDAMQCPICGMSNPESVRICVSCHTTLPAVRAKAPQQQRYVYARHDGSWDRSYLHTTLSGVERFRRTRYLTGSSSAKTTSSGTPTRPAGSGEEVPTQRRTRTDRASVDAPTDQRVEPSIDDHAFPPGPSNAYERLHGLGPEFGEAGYQPPVRSRLSRIAMMASVFVVGAGVGLAAAWWLHKAPPATPVSAVPASTVRSVPATPAVEGRRSAAIRGISPSELPYDGAPPPTAAQSDPEPVVSGAAAVPETSVGASVGNTTGERNAGAGIIERDGAVAMPAVPSGAVQKSGQVPQRDDDAKTVKAAKQGNASADNATPKRRSATRTDREIERIRRQVDEELKKKTEHGHGPSAARPDSQKGARSDRVSRPGVPAPRGVTRVSATRASLAECDRKTNFIRRELCRWRICNGSWGKNGCPSYQQQASTY